MAPHRDLGVGSYQLRPIESLDQVLIVKNEGADSIRLARVPVGPFLQIHIGPGREAEVMPSPADAGNFRTRCHKSSPAPFVVVGRASGSDPRSMRNLNVGDKRCANMQF
jgi:hypothetical protein